MEALAKCPLFAGLSPAGIAFALGGVDYKLVRFARHDVYALAGMPCEWADIVLTGTLVCRMSSK